MSRGIDRRAYTGIAVAVFLFGASWAVVSAPADDAVPKHVTVSKNSTQERPHAVGFDVIPPDKELHLYLDATAPTIIRSSIVEVTMKDLWRRVSATDAEHKWVTQSVTTDANFAAMFSGTLGRKGGGGGQPGTGPATQPTGVAKPDFWAQTSQIDLDADTDNTYHMVEGRRSPATQPASRAAQDKYESIAADSSGNGNGGMVMAPGEGWCNVELVVNPKVPGKLHVASEDDEGFPLRTATSHPVTDENIAAAPANRHYILRAATTQPTTQPVTIFATFTPTEVTGTMAGTTRDEFLVNAVAQDRVVLAILNTYEKKDDFFLQWQDSFLYRDAYMPVMVTWTGAPEQPATVNLRETDREGNALASGQTITFHTRANGAYTAVTSITLGGTEGRQKQVFVKATERGGKHIRAFVVGNAAANSVNYDPIVFSMKVKCNYECDASEHMQVPADLRFSVECTDSVGGQITAWRWGYTANTPNINTPEFAYTAPTATTTNVKRYHWYGHGDVADDMYDAPDGGESTKELRWMGNTTNPCSYAVWCDVRLCDGGWLRAPLGEQTGTNGKYYYVRVEDAGRTKLASLNHRRIACAAGADGKWRITGMGTMVRTAAEITRLPSANSEFYNKSLAHESKHISDWEDKDADGKHKYRNREAFFNLVNGKGWAMDSEDELRGAIESEYGTWKDSPAGHPGPGKSGLLWGELGAYHEEYRVAPIGVRERSDGWITGKYDNDSW